MQHYSGKLSRKEESIMVRNGWLIKAVKGLWLTALLLYAWGVVPKALAQELEGTAYPMNDLSDGESGVTPFAASIAVSTVTSTEWEFADFPDCQPPEETTFSLADVTAGTSVAYWVGVKGVAGQKAKVSFEGPKGQLLKCSFKPQSGDTCYICGDTDELLDDTGADAIGKWTASFKLSKGGPSVSDTFTVTK
ncbi:MAG: hypothetical protein HYZ72_14630 [Deltaproteobacteria bacterium]|nr:hypothetical protein [Deltaproteobacteria bacterium]